MKRLAWFVIAFAFVLGASCKKADYPTETREVFGLPVTVTIFADAKSTVNPKDAFDKAFATMTWWQRAALESGPQNQVEKISTGAGRESIPVDPPVYDMLMRALQINDMAGEYFDIRYGPLLDLWKVDKGLSKPSQAEIDTALTCVTQGGMFVAGKSILLSKEGMRFDVRGFVDAWAVDRAADELVNNGVTAFEVRTPYLTRLVGLPAGDQSYDAKLGAAKGEKPAWAAVNMTPGGLAFVPAQPQADKLGMVRAVMNPATGQLANGSAAVLAKDCATAYGLAYALLASGDLTKLKDKAKTEIQSYILYRDGEATQTLAADGMLKDKLRVLQ
ncbi:FAD:protein FMN transferase [bacterium]|nr:FAD:protein FMN transferase [bacterium]